MVSSKQTDMADKKGRAHTKSSLASELEQGRRQFKNIESNRERDSTLILFQKTSFLTHSPAMIFIKQNKTA